MKKKKILFSITVLAMLSSCAKKDMIEKHPNIIFILSDDHGWQAISAYNSKITETPDAKTPNIDRLAKEGMLFQNGYVTNSLCAPSRAVILTGRYSYHNGVMDNHTRFDSSQVTYPKLFQKNGYETALFGKWHLKSTPSGFDYYEILPGQGVYYNPNFIRNGKKVKYEGYSTNIITENALKWIQNRKQPSKPFLLEIHYKAPHSPHLTDVPFFNWGYKGIVAAPVTLFADHAGKSSAVKNNDLTIAGMYHELRLHLINPEKKQMNEEQRTAWHHAYDSVNKRFRIKIANLSGNALTYWKYQRFIKEYLRTVHVIDINVGRIEQFLKDNNLEKNTVVVYTSDQGYFLGEHGFFDKRLMYQPAFKMPLIIRWPNVIKPGVVDNHIVSNLDFAETLLDIAGISIPKKMQGISFKPILLGKKLKQDRKYIYYHYYADSPPWGFPKHEGLFDGRFKLIHFYTTDEWEFYDMKKDPLEIDNLYTNDNYQSKILSLKRDLIKLKEKYKVK